jgi:hypothetical protein
MGNSAGSIRSISSSGCGLGRAATRIDDSQSSLSGSLSGGDSTGSGSQKHIPSCACGLGRVAAGSIGDSRGSIRSRLSSGCSACSAAGSRGSKGSLSGKGSSIVTTGSRSVGHSLSSSDTTGTSG